MGVAFFPPIQNDRQHIEGELRNFDTQFLEVVTNLVAQSVTLVGPVRGHWPPDGRVVRWSVRVHVSGIGKLCCRCSLDFVNLAVCEVLQRW